MSRSLSRSRSLAGAALGLALATLAPAGVRAQWTEYVDETATRLVADPAVGAEDEAEKDFAWGDVDNDGDIDLVVVRKQPFTTPGRRTNVLFLNEGGVLVDRTAEYVVASDVAGDMGFLTPTNDRDVALADLTGDGWLDIVTATTLSDGAPRHIGYPRVYVNLGEDPDTGDWLGFRYVFAQIPALNTASRDPAANPRFCAVAVGDVNGDGFPDLYFSDYDTDQPEGHDFDDRLLMNDRGLGFTDATSRKFAGTISLVGEEAWPFPASHFGASSVIADMNGDGLNDIVKQSSLDAPLFVGIAYNSSNDAGFFDSYSAPQQAAPYFVSAGDLNRDDRLDLVISDDGDDQFLLNMGNDQADRADFVAHPFNYQAQRDSGFGSNSLIIDLNQDSWNDVLIADVDVDTSGCLGRLRVFRNLGGRFGGDVNLLEQVSGENCQFNSPECEIVGIPADRLTGTHDVAVFDIDGDGWNDMVLGRCSGTQVYMGRQPSGLIIGFPVGLPASLVPNNDTPIRFDVRSFGAAVLAPESARLILSVGDGPFQELPTSPDGLDEFAVTIPGVACTERVRYYFHVESTEGEVFLDPPKAPADTYGATASLGTLLAFQQGFEENDIGWEVINDPSLTSGGWERAAPIGTIDGFGEQAAPSEDAEPLDTTRFAFVTGNGAEGDPVGAHDVDGGPTVLISEPINLLGGDGTMAYSRWFYSNVPGRSMSVSISNDGETWVDLETLEGAQNHWQRFAFLVSDYVVPSAEIRLRFVVSDTPNGAIVEAAVDNLTIERVICNDCVQNEDCDDAAFCNGTETCFAGSCISAAPACGEQLCLEETDTCVDCVVDGDCDDGLFCNGIETCVADTCVPGADPCAGMSCDDATDTCVECLADGDCDDGSYCNGAETCRDGTCLAGIAACPDRVCDEDGDACTGEVVLQPRLGRPLTGLTPEQLARFAAGRQDFDANLSEADGLGPIFNQSSCGSCHNTPLGGSGTSFVTRFGFNDDKGGGFDPLEDLGGSLQQDEAIRDECLETVPVQANLTARRVTPSTMGLGLVEAIPDADLLARELAPPAGVSGRSHLVPLLEDPQLLRVGRMGWKAQVATVLSFSGDAALNEMGLTNRLVPEENAPNGDLLLLADCDAVADPEDGPDGNGRHFIDRVTDFQRYLAPPPQTPRSGTTGETVFHAIGCESCHARGFRTADDPALEPALRDREIRPYSDFLLHDMGQAADFIAQGDAGQREIRTPSLWGLRVRDPLWHDGRFLGDTFPSRVRSAIAEHDAFGSEARPAAQAFAALPLAEQDAVIAFLGSLGRAEFDLDGNGAVNADDFDLLQDCLTGPGSFYTADDECAISDVDQDGDVDDDDFAKFVETATGVAGAVPDGAGIPGEPLRVQRGEAGGVELTWGSSCLSRDIDYAVYAGMLGDFASHASRTCSTSGALTTVLPDEPESLYFLVVPLNGFREGSYGTDGAGGARPAGAGACFPQAPAICE